MRKIIYTAAMLFTVKFVCLPVLKAEVFFEEISDKHRQRLTQLFLEENRLIDISFTGKNLLYTFYKKTIKNSEDFFLRIFRSEKNFLEGIEFYKKQNYVVQALAFKEEIGFAVFFQKVSDQSMQNFEIVKIPYDRENIYSVQMLIRAVNDRLRRKKIPTANAIFNDYLYQCFRSQDDYGFSLDDSVQFSIGQYNNAKEMHQDLANMQKQGRQLTAFSAENEKIFALFVYRVAEK